MRLNIDELDGHVVFLRAQADRLEKLAEERHYRWAELDAKKLRRIAELANYAQQYEWRPIETAPERVEALFWIRPGTREDGDWYCDTSGNPILAHDVPRLFMGMRGSWSSLMKATHWMPLPHPPQSDDAAPR